MLQKKHKGGAVLHMTNAWKGRKSPTCLGYFWRRSCQLFTYQSGTISWM